MGLGEEEKLFSFSFSFFVYNIEGKSNSHAFNLENWYRKEGKKRLRKTLNKCHSSQTSLKRFLFPSDIQKGLILDIPPSLFLFIFLLTLSYFFTTISTDLTVSSLGSVHVTIPNAIQSGRNAIMTCDYELENDDLYSVKWYKGKREFVSFFILFYFLSALGNCLSWKNVHITQACESVYFLLW